MFTILEQQNVDFGRFDFIMRSFNFCAPNHQIALLYFYAHQTCHVMILKVRKFGTPAGRAPDFSFSQIYAPKYILARSAR